MLAFENFLWLLILIGVMILIHELGHYWAARLFDVRVETFSFGFGPRLFGFRKGETDFRFSAILFGGYVKMAGQEPGDQNADDSRSFLAKPRWQRLIIMFAGPFMNVVLAVALLTGLFMVKFPQLANQNGPAVVGHVAEDSAAERAGIREGDRILQFDGKAQPSWEDIFYSEIASANRSIEVLIERGEQRFYKTITPKLDEEHGVGVAGWLPQSLRIAEVVPDSGAAKANLRPRDVLVKLDGQPVHSVVKLHELLKQGAGKPVQVGFLRDGREQTATVHPSLGTVEGRQLWLLGVELEPQVVFTKLPFAQAAAESFRQNVRDATLIYRVLQGMIEQRLSAKTLQGPIGMARLSGTAAREGATEFVRFMAAVSLNLAILNLLPIPVLDGGGILLLLIEMVMRRNLSTQVKEAVAKVGFVFLVGLMVFVLFNDISKMIPKS